MDQKTYWAGMNLESLDRVRLLTVINELAEGGRWFCGVTGNKQLAKSIGVGPKDLETLSAWCWCRISGISCGVDGDKRAEKIYEEHCDIHYDELPSQLQWNRN